MRETWAQTARLMYNKTGIVAHHNNDMWGDTVLRDNHISATFWPNGLTWTAAWINKQYRFTDDKDFLKQNYEMMTDLLEFYFRFLTDYDG
jgi:alpha-L-fucosidase 2